MNRKRIIMILICGLLSACGVGQKKLLFTTRSNVGLDIDAKQFTAQLNIDRQEAVIGPTFEGGQHFPIAAAFLNNNRFLGGFGVSSLFSGGAAALALTECPTMDTDKITIFQNQAYLGLTQEPKIKKSLLKRFWGWLTRSDSKDEYEKFPGPGEVKPFIFDTDTSLGVKVAWTGATAEFPDKVKIGFNREEFALASVMRADASSCIGSNKPFCIGIPSFFAALDTETELLKMFTSSIGFRQVFAVGVSATNLAANPKIRSIIDKRFFADVEGFSGLCKK